MKVLGNFGITAVELCSGPQLSQGSGALQSAPLACTDTRYNKGMTTAQKTTTKLNVISPVDALLEATAKLLSVVPPKSPKPVLSNIRFSVRDGVLELSGTDYTAGIHYSVPSATVKEEGSGLLNAVKFEELLKEFRGTEAAILFTPRGGCKFKAKGGRYKVVGDDIRDYPKMPRFDRKPGFDILGSDVVDMIKKTSFAAAPEESRLTINGILLELKEGRFRLAATDNKRMAITERYVATTAEDFRVAVPQRFLKAILKVTTKDVAGKNATIGVTGTKVFYRLPGVTIYSTIMQGVFPPYQEALGLRLKHHIDCSTKELLNTLRRAMLVNSDLTAFIFESGIMNLKVASSAIGDGTASMSVDLVLEDGARIRVGFNPGYFKDALEVITTKRCRFLFEGPRNAGVLKELVTAIGSEGTTEDVSDEFVYAVMPALLPAES